MRLRILSVMPTFRFFPASPLTLDSCRGCVLVLIDASLQDYWRLASGLEAGAKAVVIHPHTDGVDQITSLLVTQTCLDSVHILSSGSPGSIQLGSTVLSLETLDRYAQDLQVWFFLSQICNHHPSMHLYGSNVAEGNRGKAFLQRLYHLTGAGVLASSSCTGNLLMGGNWDLEQQMGPVYRRNVIRPEVLANYDGLL